MLFALNFYSGCSTIDPIVSDICSITDDICFYANSICDLYNQDSTQFKDSKFMFSKLTDSLDRLKQIHSNLKQNQNKKISLSKSDLLIELQIIREDLRTLLPE